MSARGRDSSDERNTSFDPDLIFDELRPGFDAGATVKRTVAEGQDRLSPRDSREVPQEPLQKRVRREPRGD